MLRENNNPPIYHYADGIENERGCAITCTYEWCQMCGAAVRCDPRSRMYRVPPISKIIRGGRREIELKTRCEILATRCN